MYSLLPTLAFAAFLAIAPDAAAQSARQMTASHADIVVMPALPGEAMRITTARHLPTARASLGRYRSLRVYRPAARRGALVAGQPVMPAVYTAQGDRFVQRGGSYFYAGSR